MNNHLPQSSEERLREKIREACMVEFRPAGRLCSISQKQTDAVLGIVKAELGAALQDTHVKVPYTLVELQKAFDNGGNKVKAEIRNHFGIGEDV